MTRKRAPIEAVHIQRFKDRQWGINDPCFICGGKFKLNGSGCGHDGDETKVFIDRIRAMTPTRRQAILKGK